MSDLSLDLSNNEMNNLEVVEILVSLEELKIIKLVLTNNDITNEGFD